MTDTKLDTYRVESAGGGVYYIFEKKDGDSRIYGMTAGTGAKKRAEKIAKDANEGET